MERRYTIIHDVGDGFALYRGSVELHGVGRIRLVSQRFEDRPLQRSSLRRFQVFSSCPEGLPYQEKPDFHQVWLFISFITRPLECLGRVSPS